MSNKKDSKNCLVAVVVIIVGIKMMKKNIIMKVPNITKEHIFVPTMNDTKNKKKRNESGEKQEEKGLAV